MAYIGRQPDIDNYSQLDDFSGTFNGSTATFAMTVDGQAVFPATENQLIVSLGGVLQEPGLAYSITDSNITFTTAPVAGTTFFAILLGELLATTEPADGSITPVKVSGSYDLSRQYAFVDSGTFSISDQIDQETVRIFADTSSGPFTIRLPATTTFGATVTITGNFGANNLTVNAVGSVIRTELNSSDIVNLTLSANNTYATFVYDGSNSRWRYA